MVWYIFICVSISVVRKCSIIILSYISNKEKKKLSKSYVFFTTLHNIKHMPRYCMMKIQIGIDKICMCTKNGPLGNKHGKVLYILIWTKACQFIYTISNVSTEHKRNSVWIWNKKIERRKCVTTILTNFFSYTFIHLSIQCSFECMFKNGV